MFPRGHLTLQWQFYFEKWNFGNLKKNVLAIFWHSNGNFPDGQVIRAGDVITSSDVITEGVSSGQKGCQNKQKWGILIPIVVKTLWVGGCGFTSIVKGRRCYIIYISPGERSPALCLLPGQRSSTVCLSLTWSRLISCRYLHKHPCINVYKSCTMYK